MINVLHLSPWPLGGATSYVVNLSQTLRQAGVQHRVVRLAKKTEHKLREIGAYGVNYQNVSIEAARKGRGCWLLASAPTDTEIAKVAVELVEKSKGAYVFHDPNEFQIYPHWKTADRNRVICIRETGLDSMPKGKFIPHPYVRFAAPEEHSAPKPKHACSIARVSAVKNAHWILEANMTLPERLRVDLKGSVNRMWWNFNVRKKHPDWPYPEGAGFDRVRGAAVQACKGYRYMVDLTVFKNDGGGTQYSFLEAIDAGAVPIMTKNWCGYKGVARELGFQVGSAEELKEFLLEAENSKAIGKETDSYREKNYQYLLRTHDPLKIAAAYKKVLLGV